MEGTIVDEGEVFFDNNGNDDEDVGSTGEGSPGEIKVHLGSNLFATSRRSHSSCDIRHHFFLPQAGNTIHPTRRGVSLTLQDMRKITSAMPTIEKMWGELRVATPCSHQTMVELTACDHCVPKRGPQLKRKGGFAAVEATVSKLSRTIQQGGDTQDDETPSTSSYVAPHQPSGTLEKQVY